MTAVVVGAGFTGVTVARELLRAGWDVVLVDSVAQPGQGLGAALQLQRGRVCRIFEAIGGLIVLLDNDVTIVAQKVVLAMGSPPAAAPFPVTAAVAAHPGYVADPRRPGALDGLPEGRALLIGTGLTAVDAALRLARRGRELAAVSRHGQLPQVDAPHATVEVPLPTAATLAAMMRQIRALTERHDWRSVMDALRPHWNELWQRLSVVDRDRFLRHAARLWTTHRHRMTPARAVALAALIRHGRIELRLGEVCGVTPARDGRLRVVTRAPTGIEVDDFAVVVSCTGPGNPAADRLTRTLVADGLAVPGPHGLGLHVDEHGGLIGRSARPPQIYAVGPARRGALWETTAAPEIQAQARALAAHLRPAAALARPR